jgi:hypothetical protein
LQTCGHYEITYCDMIQGECEKCEDRGDYHGPDCLVRKLIFNQKHEPNQLGNKSQALEAAVLALQNFISRGKQDDMDCQIIPFASIKNGTRGKMSVPETSVSTSYVRIDLDLERLKLPFEEKEIEFRLSQCGETKDGKIWAQCLAYITSRAIMDRLDSVCGAGNWKVSYEFVGATGVVCNLSILINGQWITKQDGAEMTNIESFKGGISSALKRAGSAWGMGRYLYSLEAGFIPSQNIFDSRRDGAYYGKTKSGREFYWLPPKLPSWALPKESNTETPVIPPKIEAKKVEYATKDMIVGLFSLGRDKGVGTEDIKNILMKLYSIDTTKDLTLAQYNGLKDSIVSYKRPKQKEVLPWEKHLSKEAAKL